MKKEILFLLVVMTGFALIQTLHFGQGSKDIGPILVQADDATFAQRVTASGEWSLIKFWAPWCSACRRLMPNVKELAEEKQDVLTVIAVNVDEATMTASQFQARSIPLLVLLKDGREVTRSVGMKSYSQLESWVTEAQENAPAPIVP